MCAGQCNGYHQTVSTLTRAGVGVADLSSVSGGGTVFCGGPRPASASADRSTTTDLVSPDLTSACPDVHAAAAAAVFRPIRRPYGTVSSQDEDFSFFDTEDDDDDDLCYNGQSHSLHSSNLVCKWILGCSCPRTTNWPPSGRALGNVSNFEISGPPQYLSVG